MSTPEIEGPWNLVEHFEQRTLPKSEWTHGVHLTVGLWYLLDFGLEQAGSNLRRRIPLFNQSIGIVNDEHSGYHETLTIFFLRSIADFAARSEADNRLELLDRLLESRLANVDLPLEYYSREHLFSVRARRFWVEPDLKPLAAIRSQISRP